MYVAYNVGTEFWQQGTYSARDYYVHYVFGKIWAQSSHVSMYNYFVFLPLCEGLSPVSLLLI